MRVLHARQGFQADHSSSSYLFYAIDSPVSAEGQRVAHEYSSRAEVSSRRVRYEKWGDSELGRGAYKALLGAHFDVMVSESYDTWTLAIALKKTKALEKALAPFKSACDFDEAGMRVEDWGERLAVFVYCRMDMSAAIFAGRGSAFDGIVRRLGTVRDELREGNTSFLQGVAEVFGDDDTDDDREEEDEGDEPAAPPVRGKQVSAAMTKRELLEECERRGVEAKWGWTKERILAALTPPPRPRKTPAPRPQAPSRAAQDLLDAMTSE